MNKSTHSISIWETNPISSLLQKVHYQFMTKNLRSLSIQSESSAEGKTTMAILLARGLSEIYQFKVLLVDLNPEGDGLINQYLKDYVTEEGIAVNHPFNFSLFRLKDLDLDWSKNMYDALFMNRMIKQFSKKYDLVIVDVPNNMSASFLKISTDSLLVVSSDKSFKDKTHKFKNEIILRRKNTLGVIYNPWVGLRNE